MFCGGDFKYYTSNGESGNWSGLIAPRVFTKRQLCAAARFVPHDVEFLVAPIRASRQNTTFRSQRNILGLYKYVRLKLTFGLSHANYLHVFARPAQLRT